jgi:Zn-dependent protease
VVSIFVHECGHAIAGKSRGIPISNMVFIPFMGAAVMLKRGGRTVGEDAFIGIMGPVFGMLYALACLGIFFATKQPLFLMLAYAVAFMNLLNLLPIAPLDGGWIVPVFSPKILALGAIFTIPVAIWWHNPFVLILGLLSLPRIIGGWKVNPAESAYFKATSRDRWTYAFAYPAIALALAGMMSGTHTLIQFIRAGGII